MKLIEELKKYGFEEVDRSITPVTLLKDNCKIVLNDYATVNYNNGRFSFQEPDKLISFLREEKIII